MKIVDGEVVATQEDLAFATEANDILRDLWNRRLLPEVVKVRVAKLLEVSMSDKAI